MESGAIPGRRKQGKKAIEARIDRAYGRSCSGVLVSVLDLGKIHAEGLRVVALGGSDEELERALRQTAEKYRVQERISSEIGRSGELDESAESAF